MLHDVVEDGGVDLSGLRDRSGPAIAAAVDALSRREGEDYDAFIARCAAAPVARAVKRADLADNLDLSRLPEPTERDHRRAEKNRRALALLDAITD